MVSPLPMTPSCFLLSLVLCLFCHSIHAAVKEGFHEVSVDSLVSAGTCSSSKGSSENSLKIVHRFGPCSPLGGKSRTNLKKMLVQDQLRVEFLKQKFLNTSENIQLQASEATVPARSGAAFGSGNYLVTIGVGTPKKDQTVIFDTGSNVCWIQCQPCAKYCHPQQEPVFDPSSSTTYRNVTCTDPSCSQLTVNGCSNSGRCIYGVLYGDKSSTVGLLAKDTLTLSPSESFPDFIFGCGQNNQGLFGKTAGLLGLARDPLSLALQTSKKYGKVFSYCLPTKSSITGDLTLGAGKGNSISYTPMLSDSRAPSLYGIGLTGLSVGGTQLSISSSSFSSSVIIIDSGTVVTRLPQPIFDALRTAFRSGMKYPLGKPIGPIDTCYDLSGQTTISVPTVSMQYRGGAVVNLEIPGIFIVADITQVCLAFLPTQTNVGIIGNTQQRGMEVVYDIGASRIGFGPGTCK